MYNYSYTQFNGIDYATLNLTTWPTSLSTPWQMRSGNI